MKNILKKLNLTYIIIAVVIALTAVGLVVYKEAVEQRRIDDVRSNIVACEDSAWDAYDTDWESECVDRDLEEDCSLPLYASDRVDERLQQSLDNCIRINK